MKDNFDELKKSWESAKKDHPTSTREQMLETVLKNHDRSQKAHIGNGSILSVVVIGLVAFFYYLAPLQETLSRVGIGLMIGGLIVRVIIEVISYRKAGRINYSATSGESVEQARSFYLYRKEIHGPVTISIVVFYTIGFYVLTPEFSDHFSTFWMWMMDGSYLVIGIVLFLGIRKGVVQEMRDLQRITEIQDSMNES